MIEWIVCWLAFLIGIGVGVVLCAVVIHRIDEWMGYRR